MDREPYWEGWIRTNHSTPTSSSSRGNILTPFAFLFLRMIFKFSQLHHRSAGLLLLCRDNSAVVIYLCIIIDTHYHFSCPATFWSPVCYGKEIVGGSFSPSTAPFWAILRDILLTMLDHCGAGSPQAQTSTLKLHYHKFFHPCHSGQSSPSSTKVLYGCHTSADCPCQRQFHQGSISRLKTFSIRTGMGLSPSHAWHPSGWLQLSHAQTPFNILYGPRQSKTYAPEVYKKQKFGQRRGEINSYFDFWGRLIQFF